MEITLLDFLYGEWGVVEQYITMQAIKLVKGHSVVYLYAADNSIGPRIR